MMFFKYTRMLLVILVILSCSSIASARFLTEDPLGYEGGDVNLYRYVGNDPVNYVDPLGLSAGQFPPSPPGHNPTTWQQAQWDNGKWYLKSPDGRIYTVHPEDKGHWRHWDIQGPGGKDEGSWPPNPRKPKENQKKLKRNQCATDPSGNAPDWSPLQKLTSEEYPPDGMPFMPFNPLPTRVPVRVPIRIPFRVPIFGW